MQRAIQALTLLASLLMLQAALLAQKNLPALPPALFDEPYRPQYHFTPAINWTNDPNGAVYFDGEYHLFYQYNPFGDQWGHMTWGHAVSPDLVHWQQLPPAIPEENGIMIFSGSVVVDRNNSSGFCKNPNAPVLEQQAVACLVAIYTGHTEKSTNGEPLQTQNIAYSNDRGRTFTKYAGNPVIDLHLSDFRDPKVFWHAGTKRWAMVVSLPKEHKVRLFTSKNLREWGPLSDFGPAGATDGFWECPDLFELPIIGEPGKKRWVLSVNINPGAPAGGSGNQYFVGQFDGTRFTNDNPPDKKLWADDGKDFYASTSFSDVPDGRRIWMAWMSNWDYARDVPTSPWRGGMTIPRELSLKRLGNELRLTQQPVVELEQLRENAFSADNLSVEAANRLLAQRSFGESYEVEVALALGKSSSAGIKVRTDKQNEATSIGVTSKSELFVDRTKSGVGSMNANFPGRHVAPMVPDAGVARLHIFVDRSSIEVFGGDGETAITDLTFPYLERHGVEFFSEDGNATIQYLKIWKLKSAVRY